MYCIRAECGLETADSHARKGRRFHPTSLSFTTNLRNFSASGALYAPSAILCAFNAPSDVTRTTSQSLSWRQSECIMLRTCRAAAPYIGSRLLPGFVWASSSDRPDDRKSWELVSSCSGPFTRGVNMALCRSLILTPGHRSLFYIRVDGRLGLK